MDTSDWIWAAAMLTAVITTWLLMRQSHITKMIEERQKHERCYAKLEWYESQSLIAGGDTRRWGADETPEQNNQGHAHDAAQTPDEHR